MSFPSIRDLKKLPLRAQVAYALRASLRTKPIYQSSKLLTESALKRLEETSQHIQSFLSGENDGDLRLAAIDCHAIAEEITERPVQGAALAMAYTADAAAKASFADYANRAAGYASSAAAFACDIDYVFTPQLNATVFAEDVAYAAANAVISGAALQKGDALVLAACHDARDLSKLESGDFPQLGDALNTVPLFRRDKLWPQAASPWLASALSEAPTAYGVALAIWYSAGFQLGGVVSLDQNYVACFCDAESQSTGDQLKILESVALIQWDQCVEKLNEATVRISMSVE